MIEGYIDAAIRQAQERARILKAKISYSPQVNEFVALRQTCDNLIDGLIDDFGLPFNGLSYSATRPRGRTNSALSEVAHRSYERGNHGGRSVD